jgi:LacI family transcriptional regulator
MPYIPDAIVCANDDIAKDLYYILKEKNISIPRDVAIIGFDDKEEAQVMTPPLSTVHIPNKDLGIRLVQELFWRIDSPERTKEMVAIATQIVTRESSIRSSALD